MNWYYSLKVQRYFPLLNLLASNIPAARQMIYDTYGDMKKKNSMQQQPCTAANCLLNISNLSEFGQSKKNIYLFTLYWHYFDPNKWNCLGMCQLHYSFVQYLIFYLIIPWQ